MYDIARIWNSYCAVMIQFWAFPPVEASATAIVPLDAYGSESDLRIV
jgi:hypothetical protein